MSRQPEPHYLAVGRVLRPHGVRGELRVEILTDYPERLVKGSTVYVGTKPTSYTVTGVRFHKDLMLLRLDGCESRDAADSLRGALVQVALKDAAPLTDEEYYHFQLEGLQVETGTGEELGEIVEVLSLPDANDVYVVHGLRGELLLPAIQDVIKCIDLEAERVIVHLLPGLLGDED